MADWDIRATAPDSEGAARARDASSVLRRAANLLLISARQEGNPHVAQGRRLLAEWLESAAVDAEQVGPDHRALALAEHIAPWSAVQSHNDRESIVQMIAKLMRWRPAQECPQDGRPVMALFSHQQDDDVPFTLRRLGPGLWVDMLCNLIQPWPDRWRWMRAEEISRTVELFPGAMPNPIPCRSGADRAIELALAELVRLHDGPRDAAYEAAEGDAWNQARRALGLREVSGDGQTD